MPTANLKIIGRKDCADFPELKLSGIVIKIDTGAYTSSINCSKAEETLVNNQKEM